MRLPLLLFLLSLAAPARAEVGSALDCASAEGAAEALVCADAGLAALDRALADRYAAALDAAGGKDAGAAEAREMLRATQRDWIKARDRCSGAPDLRVCIEAAYLSREAVLVAEWMLQGPSRTAVWLCGANRATKVVTMFFDTQQPSVRFEHGDSIDTGTIVRTASGARYEGSVGRWIWIKGEAATYREPDGTEHECILDTQG